MHFAEKIIHGRRDLSALRDIVQDLALAPVAVLYYLFGRYFFSKSFIASGKCNACNRCLKECPVHAIKTVDGRPYWTHHCESCMQCMNLCPHRAIETAHGYIIGLLFIVNTIILTNLNRTLGINQFFREQLLFPLDKITIMIYETVILLACLFLTYRIIHYLLRFRFFEKIMIYTSLTKYKFWRRYGFFKIKY